MQISPTFEPQLMASATTTAVGVSPRTSRSPGNETRLFSTTQLTGNPVRSAEARTQGPHCRNSAETST